MARRMQFVGRPKRTLAALAVALGAVGVAVGSGADFSAQTANPSNTFTAGTLTMDNSKSGAAIFAPSNMKPGAPAQTGTVDIQNTGSLAGVFSLSMDSLSSTDTGTPNPSPFAGKVTLTVVDCGKWGGSGAPACGDSDDVTVYDHKSLSAFTAAVDLGSFDAGEKHRYQFAASLDGSAGDQYQGDSSSARFVWNAAQS